MGPELTLTAKLASVRQARPKQAATPTGRTFVLHYSHEHLAVGPLLGHNPKALSATNAKKWAATTIPNKNAHLISWTAFRDHSGYSTVDAISGDQFALRQYPDGWRLTKMLSRADGTRVETENEARAWAASVLEFREQITGPAWKPGPTPTEDIVTLYAEV